MFVTFAGVQTPHDITESSVLQKLIHDAEPRVPRQSVSSLYYTRHPLPLLSLTSMSGT